MKIQVTKKKINILNGMTNILFVILRSLKFGDGNIGNAIQPNVIVKLQKVII